MEILVIVLQFFASLSLLVIVHEFGHYIMARLFKVRVEKFYLFFNPGLTLFKFKPKKSETEYGIGWLPLGGYVKIAGMIDESLDKGQMQKPAQSWEFRSKPAWQRLLIMVAGVVFNFILALIIYSAVLFAWGETYLPLKNVTSGMDFSEYAKDLGFQNGDILLKADTTELLTFDETSIRQIVSAEKVYVLRDGKEVGVSIPDDFMQRLMQTKQGFANYRFPFVVDSILPGSRAELAGLQRGDSLVSIGDSVKNAFTMDFLSAFSANKNIPLKITVIRSGEPVVLTVTPDYNGRVGVFRKSVSSFYALETREFGLFESISSGIQKGVNRLTSYVSDMRYVFTKEGAQSLGGFITVGSLFPYPFNAQIFWEMTAFLSVILAFVNILPIPALDGGHVAFLLYEVVTRRKPSEKFLVNAQIFGMIFLLALVIFANLNDVLRLF